MDDNIFMVKFGSEGDWKHVLNNGPWQFDLSVIVIKDYDGSTRPSSMIFDSTEAWVRVLDLPFDYRTEEFGYALKDWLGEIIKVDVERDGTARGKHLRVRTRLSVYEPLVRGFFLRTSQDDPETKTWYTFAYEKIPHFCFEC